MNTVAKLTSSVTASLLIFSSTAVAGLKDDPIVFKTGKWEVRKSVDSMTDKITCTGVYGKNFGYQLTDDSLYLRVRGGIQSRTLRYGDNKAEKTQLATYMEKEIGHMIIKDGAFRKLLTVNRLRTQAYTYLDTIDSKDIDLTGANKVVSFIKSGCKVASSGKPQKPETTNTAPKATNEHTHGDRTHSHPLPTQGVAHQHGGGAVGR